MKNKVSLREEMKLTLSSFSNDKYTYASGKIHDVLFSSDEWKKAKCIGVTISRAPEVDTEAIIERAWLENKRVAVPKCYPKDKSMEFFYLESYENLETVYFGLKEPNPFSSILCDKAKIELMLVPGLVFDKRGYRIGFGGGYYDRFLAEFKGDKISLAFTEQVKETISYDLYDIPVDKIITNEAAYGCNVRK